MAAPHMSASRPATITHSDSSTSSWTTHWSRRRLDNITYECQLSYKWTIRRVRGQHKATFRSTDWVGNVSSYTATFTV